MTITDVTFGEFRFDTANQCLWRGSDMIGLTPKSFGVLRCLVEHAGQLVTKGALLDAVWPDTAVTDASLKVCVQEIRRLLGDPVVAPRYIATVHGRGYRFIADVSGGADAARPPLFGPARTPSVAAAGGGSAERLARISVFAPSTAPRTTGLDRFVGRAGAMAALGAALERTRDGDRQVVFVTGEAGIGKTTLIETFLAGLAGGGARLARGRCLEQFGSGEAYLPLLEALGRLCRAEPEAVPVLRHRAPTWAAQMPWLIPEAERAAVEQEILGGTPARMLREVAEALEALASDQPLVVSLEDLHWSDPSTLDVVAMLAQRPEPARLLLLISYRPIDAILAAHPVKALKQRLAVQRQCEELALSFLTAADIDAYLRARLGGAAPAGLAEVVHRRTDGNPLFMVTVVDELIAARRLVDEAGGWVLRDDLDAVAAAVPESVRAIVEQQAERIDADDVALLETAALARPEFAAAMLAAALAQDPADVERRLEQLARQAQWIVRANPVELRDGAVSGCFRFTHGLYRSALAQRVPASRRAHLHLRLGGWLEQACADATAAELAMHFEQGRDPVRAVKHLRAAARIATARCAHREALADLERALALIERVPDAIRGATRRGLLEQRGIIHRARGDADAAVADFEAWRESARADGAGREEIGALMALSGAWSLRDRARGLAFADAAVECAVRLGDAETTARARGGVAYWYARIHGWRQSDATAADDALASARRIGRPTALAPYLGMRALFDNLRGHYAEAAACALEGMSYATRGGDSFAHALCRFQQTWALQHRGDWGALLVALREGLQAAERNGHRPWLVVFELLLAGWHTAAGLYADAVPRAARGLAAARADGHEYGIASGLLVSGWAAVGSGRPADARVFFDEVAARAAANPAAMEWVLRLPLHVGLSACALAGGDRARAEAEAARACNLAGEPGEPTYLGQARRALAVVALKEGRLDDAEAALAAARDIVEHADAPIAAWQVWATSAVLARTRGDQAAARTYRGRAVEVLERLAASLDAVDDATADALGISIPAAQASIRAQLSR